MSRRFAMLELRLSTARGTANHQDSDLVLLFIDLVVHVALRLLEQQTHELRTAFSGTRCAEVRDGFEVLHRLREFVGK